MVEVVAASTRGGTRSRRARAARAAISALVTTLSGCFVAYHPATVPEVKDPAAEVRVSTIDTGLGQVTVTVETKMPLGGRPAAAWLAPATSQPCSGGLAASLLGQSILGPPRRNVVFNESEVLASGLLGDIPTALDLDVLPADPETSRRCVRVPLTQASTAPTWRAYPFWFTSVGLRIFGPHSRPSTIGGGWLISLGGGAWLGPVRLRLDGLFGEAGTSRPPAPGFTESHVVLIGGATAAEIFPVHVGQLGVGLQVGYDYLLTEFSSNAGSNTRKDYDYGGPRGPRIALRVARLPLRPSWKGFEARPDAWSVAVDLFAARWTGVEGTAPLHYGLAVGGEWGRWW